MGDVYLTPTSAPSGPLRVPVARITAAAMSNAKGILVVTHTDASGASKTTTVQPPEAQDLYLALTTLSGVTPTAG